MATRRVRRDSETSTDSWSLVEEDRLDDDFSLNSTEAEEEYDEEGVEPIVEEPITSDEDTASEHSDSDCDSDSDSDLSENSELDDSESEVEEPEEEEEIEEDKEEEEESQDEEASEESEDSQDEEEEEEEVESLEMTEEEKEAARMCKEDEEWMDEEMEDDSSSYTRYSLRILLFVSLFFMLFPIADICTSWVLTYNSRRALPRPSVILNGYSQQRYTFEHHGRYYKGMRVVDKLVDVKRTKKIFTPLAEQLQRASDYFPLYNASTSNFHASIFYRFHKLYEDKKVQDPVKSNKTVVLPIWAQPIKSSHPDVCSKFDRKEQKSLAPVPPAPFTPRKVYKSWTSLPRYQPCLVHVNESKWTCQKSTTSLSVLPRNFGVSKRKIYQKKDLDGSSKKSIKQHICGKKASQSMRTTVSKPTDQCDSRHFTKYTPKRHHFHRIEYKAPLPCQLPTYRPTMPKPSKKPSKSSDDWFSRRSHVRAQLRSRA